MSIDGRLTRLRDALRRELREDILPFWSKTVIDPEHGFHGFVSDGGVVDPLAPKSGVLAARLVWTYSAAYRHLGDEALRRTADQLLAWLTPRLWDDVHGGTFWMLDHAGQPLSDRKQTYGVAFAIYALAEYRLATGDEQVLGRACDLFRALEHYAADRNHGGYFEARGRDWKPLADVRLSERDLNAPKSMNTHLHVMEAYANLARVWDTEELRERLRALVELHLERIVDPARRQLQLFFDERFHPVSRAVSFGHDIEASWLIVEAAELLGDRELLLAARENAVSMARAVLAQGYDREHGGIFAERHEDGRLDDEKHWWMQAEALVGFLSAYELSTDQAFLDAAERTWAFIDRHLVDREHGEWRWRVKRDGSPIPGLPKVEPWKCPYHNTRAALEVMSRVDRLLGH